jgi:hypothetical protein
MAFEFFTVALGAATAVEVAARVEVILAPGVPVFSFDSICAGR